MNRVARTWTGSACTRLLLTPDGPNSACDGEGRCLCPNCPAQWQHRKTCKQQRNGHQSDKCKALAVLSALFQSAHAGNTASAQQGSLFHATQKSLTYNNLRANSSLACFSLCRYMGYGMRQARVAMKVTTGGFSRQVIFARPRMRYHVSIRMHETTASFGKQSFTLCCSMAFHARALLTSECTCRSND
jgi:hypothetical protein